jgi:large subunit ribosomal protein L31
MAKSINVTYHSDATATCSNCKSVYTLGLTMEALQIEICANCHPYYTGKESFIDSAGRIQKFQDKMGKAQTVAPKKKKVKKVRKYGQSLEDLAAGVAGAEGITVDVKGADAI